jgi:putative mRNA 3-end processing factor
VYSSATKKGIVKARVEWFDFSAHCGRSELEETIRLTKRSASIVLMHGEEGAEQVVYRYATGSGRRAYAPSAGEWLEIEL